MDLLRVIHGNDLSCSIEATANGASDESFIVEARFGQCGDFESTIRQKKRVCIVFVKLLRVWAICQAIQKGFGMSFGFQSQHVFIECVKGAFVSATVCGISNDSSFLTP